MELYRLDALEAADGVTSQDFERQDDGFLQGVGLSLEVEDVDGGVVAGRCHEWIFGVVVDTGDSFFVEGHGLVRLVAEVQVEAE